MKDNKSLESLIDFYKNQDYSLTNDDAKILAVKYICSENPNRAMNLLEIDDVLDFIFHENNFNYERDKYLKYFDYISFDRDDIEDENVFLRCLNSHSKLAKRLIAARVIDESKNLNFDFSTSKEWKNPSLYEIAYNNAKMNYGIMKENNAILDSRLKKDLYQDSIIDAISNVIRFHQDEDAYKILGEDAFLEFLSIENKLNRGFYLELAKEAKESGYIDKQIGSKKYNLLKNYLENKNSDDRFYLISKKLQNMFFPISGIDNYCLTNNLDSPTEEDF